ncbi:MAG TPA: lysylphosphatidylglycerol synthase transmembrane domain-containing protein [Acidimicrobiales bacterium]|nr:lysylphosphatidylglycerol synthase transmembrane domain-containing protein [Acidimicrobiales bacterium]
MDAADAAAPTAPPGVAAPAAPAEGRRRLDPRLRKVLQVVISLAIVVGIFWYVLGQFADISEVWDAMRTLTWREVVVLVVAATWNLATYWILTVIATPGLRYPQAVVLTETTTAVSNALPAGGALGVGLTYTILSSWGFSKSRSTLSVVVTGIWNNFAKLGLPIVALAILAVQGQPGGGRMFAAAAGLAGLVGAVVVFALILSSEQYARRVGLFAERLATRLRRLLRRGPVQGWDHAVVRFRDRVIGLVRRRWVALTAATIVGHLSLYAVLLATLRVMGVSDADVGWAQVLAAFAFARLLTAIPLTPGGVGIIELALIASLTDAGGADAAVVASVLIFRLLTYVLPILFGAITYLYWRRNRSWRDSAPPMPAELAPATAGA